MYFEIVIAVGPVFYIVRILDLNCSSEYVCKFLHSLFSFRKQWFSLEF